jgi:hypothetical protein
VYWHRCSRVFVHIFTDFSRVNNVETKTSVLSPFSTYNRLKRRVFFISSALHIELTDIIVDFKSLLNARVPKTCLFLFKFENWARTSQQSSQVHFNVWTIVNKCSYFKLKSTIQWKVLGPVIYQEGLYFIELVIIIEYEHLFTNEVQTLKCTCEFCCEVRTQSSNLET